MMQPCPPHSKAHQITSPSIIKDGKSPPPNTPFDGLPETPTVQWMDPDDAPFKYPAHATPPPPASPVPQSADDWKLGDTVRKDLEPLLNHTDPWERALRSAIAGARHLAMQAQKISPLLRSASLRPPLFFRSTPLLSPFIFRTVSPPHLPKPPRTAILTLYHL